MADGGSINLRMSMAGAEEIRAQLQKLGPAGSQAMRELERAMKQPTAGLKALDDGVSKAKGGLEDFARKGGGVSDFLAGMGPLGLAAAVGIAAFATAAGLAIKTLQDAMGWAATLTDTADAIGVNVEALQAWRFVADESGVSVQKLEGDLEKLNGVMGRFKMGLGDAKLKPVFEELGIKKEDLDSIQSADQMMLLLADRLGQVTDRAKQVAAAKALGVEDSLPILRLGSERVRELLDEAHALNLVIDGETVAAFDKADRAVELAGQRIQSEMRVAVSGLAGDFALLQDGIADMIHVLGRLIVKMGEFQNVGRKAVGDEAWAALWRGDFVGVGVGIGEYFSSGPSRAQSMRMGRAEAESKPVDLDDPDVIRAMTPEQLTARYGRSGGGFELKGHTPSGSKKKSGKTEEERAAERLKREAERAAEGVTRETQRAEKDYAKSVVAQADTAEARAASAKELLRLEDEQRATELAKHEAALKAGGMLTEEVQERIKHIASLRAQTRIADEAKIDEQRIKEQRAAMLAAEQVHLDLTVDILSMASADARTSDERRGIELQLLEIAQRRQEADLKAAIEAEKEPAARARLVDALNRLPQVFSDQAKAVRRNTAGPVESWWNDQRSSGQAREFMQGEALNALDGVNKGLIDAWTNADSAADALNRMGKVGVDALGRIRDALLEVALQRMIIQPLTNALFGGGGSGGTGLLGNFLGNLTGSIFGGGAKPSVGDSGGLLPGRLLGGKGFARGGVVGAAGRYPIGEYGFETMDLPVGARIYDNQESQRALLDHEARLRSMSGGSGSSAPSVNMPVTVVNKGSEQLTARTSQGPDGIEVILEPMVRGAVNKMGADGSLGRASALTPPSKRR